MNLTPTDSDHRACSSHQYATNLSQPGNNLIILTIHTTYPLQYGHYHGAKTTKMVIINTMAGQNRVICPACTRIIQCNNTYILICSLCISQFHIQCTNISKNDFRQHTFSNWSCVDCTNSLPILKNKNRLQHNGNNTRDDNEIANCFNKFFLNIGKESAHKIPKMDICYKKYLKCSYIKSIFMYPVTEQEICLKL